MGTAKVRTIQLLVIFAFGVTLRKASLDGDNSVFHTRSPSHLKAFPSLTQAAIPQLHQFSLNVISYKGFILVPFTLL